MIFGICTMLPFESLRCFELEMYLNPGVLRPKTRSLQKPSLTTQYALGQSLSNFHLMSPLSSNALRVGDNFFPHVQLRLEGINEIAPSTCPSQYWHLDLNLGPVCLQCSCINHHAELLP